MIIKPSSRKSEFKKLKRGDTSKKGLSTGFESLDENLKLAKGYMAILTGYPGSGKSEWLDAVLINTTLMYDWKIVYYSPENHPIEQHMSKLSEKFIGKHITEMSMEDMDKSLDYMDNHFTWLYPENPELDMLISLAQEEKEANGLDCLVIDPWNAVTHHRNGMLHEYLSEALSKLIRFARNNEVLICVVAHPTKPQRDKDGNIPIPDMYSISDGAMWFNKADYGIIVHRPDYSKNEMDVYVMKRKYKWMGSLGNASFDYNYRNGRFKCKNKELFSLPNEVEMPF